MADKKRGKAEELIDISLEACDKTQTNIERIESRMKYVQPYMWYFKVMYENLMKENPNLHENFGVFTAAFVKDTSIGTPRAMHFYMALMKIAMCQNDIQIVHANVFMLYKKVLENLDKISNLGLSITELKKINMQDNYAALESEKAWGRIYNYTEILKQLMLELKKDFPKEYEIYIKQE